MKIVIAGAGEVGSHLAKMLSSESNDITIIDPDESRLNAVAECADVITVHGNPASIEVQKFAEVGRSDLFIAVNPSTSQNVNIVSALIAKKLGCEKVTARINNEEYLNYENRVIFTDLGIDMLFYPEKIAAAEIVNMLTKTGISDSLDFARGKLRMATFKLNEDSPLIHKNVRDFSEQFNDRNLHFRIIAIRRGEQTLMPKPDMKFKYHDIVHIIAKREGIDVLEKYLGSQETRIRKVMILGGGQMAEMVAKQISSEVESVKILEVNKERCLQLAEKLDKKVRVVNGDGRNTELLLDENIRDYDAFVALTSSSETNILACVAAKRLGVAQTIAEVENIEYIHVAEDMGVDATINKKLITASRIFKLTLSESVRFVKFMTGTNAEILEFNVPEGSSKIGRPLKELDFPKDAIVGGVIRGTETIIAVGDTSFEAFDRVVVFCAPNVVKEVDKFFRKDGKLSSN